MGWELSWGRGPGALVCPQFWFVHSSPLEVTRMTVLASQGEPPSPSPCPRATLAPTRAPSTRSGTGLQPSPEEVPASFLESVSSSDPKEEGRRRGGRGGGVQTIDEEERTRGPSGREGVTVKRRLGIERKGQEGGGELPSLPRRGLCLVLRGLLQALPQVEGKGTS